MGLLLADYGASVLRIERPSAKNSDLLANRKSLIVLDLHDASSIHILLSLVAAVDVLIDPYRPGVLERHGLSPSDVLLKKNPRLVVARLTGFRRDGNYQDMAGHDINYIAVSGVLSLLGRAGQPPYAPGNIVGDFAGGGVMCFSGILMALLSRQQTGRGQVVEANMVDGSAYLATVPRLAMTTPLWNSPRGHNLLDGGCPYYDTYETMDKGKYFSIGPIEERFYSELLKGLRLKPETLPSRDNKQNWPKLRAIFEERFKEKTRAEWEEIFDGTDACAVPVLDFDDIAQRRHGQRLAVHLQGTPSLEECGPNATPFVAGGDGHQVLKLWLDWENGREFTSRPDGALVSIGHSKTKL